MKRNLILIVLLASFFNAYSQNYDLIVTTDGDSIGCRIDSINDSTIYFEMKVNNNWLHTTIKKSQVTHYKLLAIDEKSVSFKAGTSYIESPKERTSFKNIQKNAVYVENLVNLPSVNYDRILPLSNRTGIILKVGLSYYSKLFITSEALFLVGGMKHFFEIGVGYDYGQDMVDLYGRIGYRYIGKKGLMLKGGIQIVKNVPVFPSIGIGYAF